MSLGEDIVPHTASTSLSTSSPSVSSPNAVYDVENKNHKDSKGIERVKGKEMEMEKEKEDDNSLTGNCNEVVSRIKQAAASYHFQTERQTGTAESSDLSACVGSHKRPRTNQSESSSSAGGVLGDVSRGDGEMDVEMDIEMGTGIGVESGTRTEAGAGTEVIAMDQGGVILSSVHTGNSPCHSTTPIDALRAGSTPQTGTLDPTPLRYRLNAVVRHIGTDAFTGHYICDTATHETPATPLSSINRSEVNEGEIVGRRKSTVAAWSRNNDSLVNSVNEETVLSEMDTPYIFFYTRI
jgi:Ubiquitin carboxyl-terminal hydrolase